MDEFGIIDRYLKHQGVNRADVVLGIGDDAAVVRPEAGRGLVVTTDVLVNGVHFPEDTPPQAVGHKALAVNLSDVAAMGADPLWATMGLTLERVDESWLESYCAGFFALAGEFDVQLIGGDVTRGPLSIAVQVIGSCPDGGPLTRAGAREDDLVYVSGTLGDAAMGLQAMGGMIVATEPDRAWFTERLYRPAPRVALGRAIAPYATAAIDISDGLAADLGHLCEASGIGAEVDAAAVPLSGAYRRCLPQAGLEPALSFGDDYELCFTVHPDNTSHVEALAAELGERISPIGRMGGSQLEWRNQGEVFSLDEQGYRHFR